MSAPKPAPFPDQFVIAGRWARLEPLAPQHAPALFAALQPDIEARHQYLPDYAPRDEADLASWIARIRKRPDYLFTAVMDAKTDRCVGRQALMRIRPEHASIELGQVLWGEGCARTRIATEAVFLTARYVFESLGYRRFEWKCNALNEASRRAALRFGFSFEGVFRQDMIVKGESRDTAWFSMLDTEWAALKPAYEAWLSPKNFDRKGVQKAKLGTGLGEA
jgi:RimJ/RimL family protein N-acetyltransferase